MPVSVSSCPFCSWSAKKGRSQCLSCNRMVLECRPPNPDEQYHTSQEARIELMKVASEHSRLNNAATLRKNIDSRVWSAIQSSYAPLAEFTAHELARIANMNVAAVRPALLRLVEKRRIAQTGTVKIRSNRTRPKYQLLLPILSIDQTGAVQGASTSIEQRATEVTAIA